MIQRFGPIGWTIVVLLGLATGQPVGPTLGGAAIGYAVIFGPTLVSFIVDRRPSQQPYQSRPAPRPELSANLGVTRPPQPPRDVVSVGLPALDQGRSGPSTPPVKHIMARRTGGPFCGVSSPEYVPASPVTDDLLAGAVCPACRDRFRAATPSDAREPAERLGGSGADDGT